MTLQTININLIFKIKMANFNFNSKLNDDYLHKLFSEKKHVLYQHQWYHQWYINGTLPTSMVSM